MDRRRILLALCLLPSCVLAQRAIPERDYNIWLPEKAVPGNAAITVRIAGVASYQRFQSGATLAFTCGASIGAELAIGVQQLGFNTDPYEGPDATMSGPITFTSGTSPGLAFPVSGFFGDGGPFDTGTPFVFAFRPTAKQVSAWTAATLQGQTLHLSVPDTKRGAPMTVDFRWPANNAAFVHSMQPCLTAAGDKKPHG